MSGPRPRVPLLIQIVIALALGAAAGLLFGPKAGFLGEIGAFVVRLLKALATPLVFFAITDSLMRAELPASKGLRLFVLCIVNATVAGVLALTLALVVKPGMRTSFVGVPGVGENVTAPAHFDLEAALGEIIPESVGGPFVHNQVLAVVLFGVASGIALRKLRARNSGHRLSELVEEAFQLLTLLLGWVVRLVPLAVFGVVAKAVGVVGFGVFASLGLLVATVSTGLVVHVAVWYGLLLFVLAGRSPFVFFRTAAEALLTALSTGSSMATVPVTLRTLEGPLKVSPMSARLAALIGTNFNNDGIMLYEVAAAIFIAQAHGIHLGPGQLVLLCGTSALAAAGIAGVPEAGLITLSLVLGGAGLPLSELPLLLTVDWLLGRLRAATNVASDLTIAACLDGRAA